MPAESRRKLTTRCHILFMTGINEPTNPMGREMPVKQYARQELEKDKEKKLLDEIVASNNVSVPDDFTVPEVTEEQMQEMMQKTAAAANADAGYAGGRGRRNATTSAARERPRKRAGR